MDDGLVVGLFQNLHQSEFDIIFCDKSFHNLVYYLFFRAIASVTFTFAPQSMEL